MFGITIFILIPLFILGIVASYVFRPEIQKALQKKPGGVFAELEKRTADYHTVLIIGNEEGVLYAPTKNGQFKYPVVYERRKDG